VCILRIKKEVGRTHKTHLQLSKYS
jgi:hypothetical protein